MWKNYKYQSVFSNEIEYFIKYKQTLGYDFRNEISHLKQMDKTLFDLKLKSKEITKDIFYELTKRTTTSDNYYARKYHIVTDFCKYLISNNYKNIYFEDKNFHITNNYIPIIFNAHEINELFKVMDQNTKNSNERFYRLHYSYSVIFRLLYSCGLRISEVLKLTVEDVCLNKNTISIINSKNKVSRLIVMSSSMKKVLEAYIEKFEITTGLLFQNRREQKIIYWTIRYYYKKILNMAKLDTNACIHGLRHIFVNEAFNQMLEKGYDENVIIVYLHKYLGHKSIAETEYYLHFTDYNKNKLLETNDVFSKNLYEGVDLDNE